MEVIDFLLLTIDKVRPTVIKRSLLLKGNASTKKKTSEQLLRFKFVETIFRFVGTSFGELRNFYMFLLNQ